MISISDDEERPRSQPKQQYAKGLTWKEIENIDLGDKILVLDATSNKRFSFVVDEAVWSVLGLKKEFRQRYDDGQVVLYLIGKNYEK